MPRQSVLASQISPVINAVRLSTNDLQAIARHVAAILSAFDIALLLALGWLLVPTVNAVRHAATGYAPTKPVFDEKGRARGAADDAGDDEFARPYLLLVAYHMSQCARLALLVYACDCVVAALEAVGYNAGSVSSVFAKIVYTSWIARRVQSLKRHLLHKVMARTPANCDKLKFLDRVLDGVLLSLLLVKILDYLSMETGLALGSIFAVGTTGGLIISLASQEIARGIMCGFEMAASDRFYEGDNVHFGDGTQGYVVKMGFLRTSIRKYDSAVIDIPNAQLGGQRWTNVSRSHTCRVLTQLQFEYDDVPRIPDTLAAVKEEIVKACPKLIREDKPFRAMISGFESGYVEATVNCSFELPPTGEAFWANREQMLLAIDRGVRKSGIQYAKPTCFQRDDL